jgi:serine/threonine protein kinase/Tfp pilus assembly protein PilF
MEQQPTTIGRYVIKEMLGQGRWGVVYRAYDPELDRSVALKYIPLTDEAQRKRFRREAQTAANLSHPHIASIHDVIQTEEAVGIVMELLTGGTLRQHLATPLAWQESVSLLLPLCDALAYAHKRGVIHRDVKPENIPFSDSGVIKLADFGLAYVIDAPRLTRDSGMVGTPCYAAPEQIRGESVDGRADIFALAAVLYEVLTGHPLFTGDDYQVIYQITQEKPVDLSPLPGNVPPSLLESLTRALAKDPAERYPTADEFGAALRRCLGQSAADSSETSPLLSLSPLPAIQIEWPSGMSHEPEEDELLRQLYEGKPSRQLYPGVADRSISRVIVKEELLGGFGGARVLVVIPGGQNDVHQQAERVVKLGPRVMLKVERDNYDNFVREHLHTAVASRKRFAAQGTMAAIEYVFVGGRLLEPVHDLVKYYQERSAREIAKTLRALYDHLDQYWYRQGRWLKEHTSVEYGPHLPSHISLKLRPGSDDWLGPKGKPMSQNVEDYHPLDVDSILHGQEPATPGKQVQIQGFKVVRIKPWAATLAQGRARIRVEYDRESDIAQQLHIGQPMTVRGQVVATRHGLLEAVVRAAFDESNERQVFPDNDQVLASLGRRGPYPNPLKQYPALLDEMLDGPRSIIHGDLHLRNVLVDQDGRPWLIDFGRVREGHTLFDFIKLETYLRLDVLNKMPGFTLAQYTRFEEALADTTRYGLWAAGVPTNHELLKAFRVIRAVRRLTSRFHRQESLAETYFRCLLLYNLAVLKYVHRVALAQDVSAEKQARQLQAARLCFVAAAVQGRWLKNPPPPRLRLRGVLEQWREWLAERLAKFARPALRLFVAASLVALLGLGYSVYRSWRVTRQARAESLNSQCAVYLQRSDLKTAEDLCWQAIQADPKHLTAHHNLGMAYYLQGDLDRAIEQFGEAIALDPSYASPHYALGRVYDDLDRIEEALSELGLAVELDPGMSDVYSEIGSILNRQGRYAEAVTILQEGLEKGQEPNPPHLLKNLGQAYLGLGDPVQAVKYLEVAAARLSPGDVLYMETHRLLAKAYEAKGDFDKALQEWQGPLQDEPDALENIQRFKR